MLKFDDYGEVILVVGRYRYFGNIALMLESPTGERIANLSVNIEPLYKGYVYLDTNNVPTAEKFINDYKLGKFVNAYGESGYCKYPLYKMDLMRCKLFGANIVEEWEDYNE